MSAQSPSGGVSADASDAARPQALGGFSSRVPDVLFFLAHENNPGLIQKWLAEGRDANVRMDDGTTPLMLAARSGCLEAMRALLPASDARLADHKGRTALIIAAKHKEPEFVEALLDASDPDQADEHGCSALAHAAARGNADCVRALLRRADPRAADRHGYTPLMRAAAVSHPSILTSLGGASPRGRLACAQILLPLSDPDAQDCSGATALMHAASDDDADLVRLLAPRSNARIRDASGYDALSWAVHVSQRNTQTIARMLAPLSDLSVEVSFGGSLAASAPARGTALEMAAVFCPRVADDISLFAPICALKKALALAGKEKMPQAWAKLEAIEIQSAADEARLQASSASRSGNAPGDETAASPRSAGAHRL